MDYELPSWVVVRSWPQLPVWLFGFESFPRFSGVWSCTDAEEFAGLVRDAVQSWDVPALFAAVLHPLADGDMLSRVALDDRMPLEAQVFAAAHPAMPARTLDVLALSLAPRVVEAVVSRPDMTAERAAIVLGRGGRAGDFARAALARNPAVGVEMQVTGALLVPPGGAEALVSG